MDIKQIILGVVLCVEMLTAGKNVLPAKDPVVPVPIPSEYYIGIGLIMTNIDRDPCVCAGEDSPILEDHRYGGILKIGFDFNPYLGLEARLAKTFGTNNFSEVTHYGIYLKPQYAFSDDINIYGLVGYGNTKIDYYNGLISSITDEDSVAYGIGLEYIFKINDNGHKWSLWLDYSRLLSDAGDKHSTVELSAIGIGYHF